MLLDFITFTIIQVYLKGFDVEVQNTRANNNVNLQLVKEGRKQLS